MEKMIVEMDLMRLAVPLRHAVKTNSVATMDVAFHRHGFVILMMTALMDQMRAIVIET